MNVRYRQVYKIAKRIYPMWQDSFGFNVITPRGRLAIQYGHKRLLRNSKLWREYDSRAT